MSAQEIYSKKLRMGERSRHDTAAPSAAPAHGAPNSALAALYGQGAAADPALGARMSQRVRAITGQPQAQIPSAEAEAHRLARQVRGGTPDQVRAEMGQRLGADFSGVSFHADAASAARAEAMGARAYTSADSVFFGPGGFDPQVAAHELVHTVQQGGVPAEAGAVAQSAPLGGIQMWKNPFKRKKQPEEIELEDLDGQEDQDAQGAEEEPQADAMSPLEAARARQEELQGRAADLRAQKKDAKSRAAELEKGAGKLVASGQSQTGYALGGQANAIRAEADSLRTQQHTADDEADLASQAYLNADSEDRAGRAAALGEETKSGFHPFKWIKQKHLQITSGVQVARAAAATEKGAKDKLGAGVLHVGGQIKDALAETELGKTFQDKGVAGTAKHYAGKLADSKFGQGVAKLGHKIADSKFGQGVAKLGHKIADTKFGKLVGEKAAGLKETIVEKYASGKRKHEAAVEDILSEEGQANLGKMTPFQKVKFIAKNPLAYLDSHSKAGKGRVAKNQKSRGEDDSLLAEMQGMSPDEMQVTEPDDGADMQSLFGMADPEPEDEVDNAGDMQAMFHPGEQADEGPVDEAGADMQSLFDEDAAAEQAARGERENAPMEYAPEAGGSTAGGVVGTIGKIAMNKAVKSAGLQVIPGRKAGKISNALGGLKKMATGAVGGIKSLYRGHQLSKLDEELGEAAPESVREATGFMKSANSVHGKEAAEDLISGAGAVGGAAVGGMKGTLLGVGADLGAHKLIDSKGARKKARMDLINSSNDYDKHYNYALSRIANPKQLADMDPEARNQAEHRAKHLALQTIYGKGVTTRQQAAAIETDRKGRGLDAAAQKDGALKEKLVDRAGIQAGGEDSGHALDEASTLGAMNADFSGKQTFQEKRQELHNRAYEKKHATGAHLKQGEADEKGGGDGFFKTMMKKIFG